MFVYLSVTLFYPLAELPPLPQMPGGKGFRRRKTRRKTLKKRMRIRSKRSEL